MDKSDYELPDFETQRERVMQENLEYSRKLKNWKVKCIIVVNDTVRATSYEEAIQMAYDRVTEKNRIIVSCEPEEKDGT